MSDFSMYKGETWSLPIAVKNPDGTVRDISTSKLYVTVKNQYSEQDASAVWQGFTPSSGVVITNGPLGLATGTMPPSATYALQGDQAILLVYDVKEIAANGVETVVDAGTVNVLPAVTRAIQ